MVRTRILLPVLVLGVVVAGVLAAMQLSGSESVSAKTVAQRAEAARSSLVAGLGADSTLHIVQVAYDPHDLPPGPFVLPDHYRLEWWAYFGADGRLADFRSETRDEGTGEVVQSANLINSDLVITDTHSGQTSVIKGFQASAADIEERIVGAQSETAALVAPDAAATSARVDGSDTYVVEATGSGGKVRRAYIDKADYREVKWEIIANGDVAQSMANPVFEALPGDAIAGASPVAPTASPTDSGTAAATSTPAP